MRNNLGQNRSSLHSKPPNDIKVIFRKCRLMKFAVTDSAQRLTAPDFCKFDLRDAETFFFQSGSSHISLNKVLFFGKAGVPTFYPFVPFVRSNCDQNKSSPHLNRLPASKLYSEMSHDQLKQISKCSTPNGIKVIFR